MAVTSSEEVEVHLLFVHPQPTAPLIELLISAGRFYN